MDGEHFPSILSKIAAKEKDKSLSLSQDESNVSLTPEAQKAEDTKRALARVSKAGIGGEPPLSEYERNLIVEAEAKRTTQTDYVPLKDRRGR